MCVLAAQVVLHHGNALQHGGIAQQIPARHAGAARTGWSPNAESVAVLRAHRQFVDVEAGGGREPQLGSHHTSDTQLGAMVTAAGGLRNQEGSARGQYLVADRVLVSTTGQGRTSPALTASNQRGRLSRVRRLFLREQGRRNQCTGRQLLEPLGAALASLPRERSQNENALAVSSRRA